MNDTGLAENTSQTVDEIEPRKPARRILKQEIAAGLAELERPALGLFIAGLSAGLDVGFSILLLVFTYTYAGDSLPELIVEIIAASMYAVGFIFVVLGRSELFTEHTTLAVLPVFNRQASVVALARLWGIVYVANLLGGAIFAWMIANVAPALGLVRPQVFEGIATTMVAHPAHIIVASGILAGWLMGLLSWLVTAGRDTISQIVIIWLVTATIGFAHLHHSIAGSIEVLAGVFAQGPIGWSDFWHFLPWATLGNSIGGVIFVALIKYGHVIRSGNEQPQVELQGGEVERE